MTLRDAGVGFVACDMPEVNDRTVGIMALVAEAERETISRRTWEALTAAKARGCGFGNPNQVAAHTRAGNGAGAHRATGQAMPTVSHRGSGPRGTVTLRGIADEQNEGGMNTRLVTGQRRPAG